MVPEVRNHPLRRRRAAQTLDQRVADRLRVEPVLALHRQRIERRNTLHTGPHAVERPAFDQTKGMIPEIGDDLQRLAHAVPIVGGEIGMVGLQPIDIAAALVLQDQAMQVIERVGREVDKVHEEQAGAQKGDIDRDGYTPDCPRQRKAMAATDGSMSARYCANLACRFMDMTREDEK